MKEYDLTKVVELLEKSIQDLKAIIEPKRWRAVSGESFHYMLVDFTIASRLETTDNRYDEMYNSGNYFQTEAECQDFCDKVKSLLR
jgi:hypothetical protein